MKNLTSFESFVNEAKSNAAHKTQKDFSGAKNKMVSKKVQDSIKKLCESMLHEEAVKCHENDDKSQTYEGYMKEAAACMNECMNECTEVWKGSAKTTAGTK